MSAGPRFPRKRPFRNVWAAARSVLGTVVVVPAWLVVVCLLLEKAPSLSWSGSSSSPHSVAVTPTDATEIPWRRTIYGWENRDQWQLTPPRPTISDLTSAIHPVLIGLWAMLLSTAALIAFEPEDHHAATR